jgi:hypothetical protein
MDPFVTIKRDTLADLLRHVSQAESVNAVRAELAAGDDAAGDEHRRCADGAGELQQRVERGTIGDVSIDGALETLTRELMRAAA